ncbi:sugar ABC transporter substrate-binding protein [Oceanobacillus alkalisoli]|uniref:sugar ABC transporter substrate-binding protein n=1 Tax=Oceanobacillus alkalisoli TaxID=2925113 RepID=UPI001EF007CA|nr:substrate-binding domain-containing protein [Oceanobacillus alkalisoli]MCF3942850.1 substrate-binding domain-containing protein [Oceanobacillus alkalisoli]MCG5102426.1 substrate-binding domain-containing protein [Oceanobacillus alkalisoli]
MNLFAKHKGFILIGFILFLCLVMVGCSDRTSSKELPENEKIKLVDDEEKVYVGFILDTLRDERWYGDKEAFENEITELGGNVKTLAANGHTEVQIKQAELLIAEGVDVLVVVPFDGEAAAPIVELAHEAGIKIISYDRLIRNAAVDYYISFDNTQVGEFQATEILKHAPTGNYVYIGGAESDNNAVLLRDGAMNILQPLVDSGDINIIFDQYTDDWEPAIAEQNVKEILNRDQVDAIIAANDGTAGGAIRALEAAQLAGEIPVSGQDAENDALERIKAGTQTMTVEKPTEVIAAHAAEMAMKVANGEDIQTDATINNGLEDIPTILLEPRILTKDTIN